MTEKKLSSVDERKLTQAIERAATLATMDESKDRSSLLASCLKDANVGVKFAKVASDAFNKRLTVLTFQHTSDEDRTKSFPLADANSVTAALGGNASLDMLEKRASIRTSGFAADIMKPSQGMPKTAAAAAQPLRKNYEDKVTPAMLMTHLESMMQKQAAAHATMLGQLNTLEAKIEKEEDKVRNELTKLGEFEFQNICNIYGDDLASVMGRPIEGRKIKKTAGAVRRGSALERDIDTLISDVDNYVAINDGLSSYQAGLSEFCKTASKLGNQLIKTAGPSLLAGDLLRYGSAVGMTGLTTGIKAGEQITDAINAAVDNIDARWEAAKKHTAKPDKYLDSEFLLRDRYNDRLLTWSDMAADPLFAQYPAEQVFMATQKAMDMDLSLERPDRREALRAEVAQILAQNGRVSTADIAALATTLRGLESTKGNAAAAAAAVVSALDKKEAPAAVELKDVVQRDMNAKWRTKDYMAEAIQKSEAAHEAAEREKDREISRAAAERAKVDWEQRQEDRAYNLEQRDKDAPLRDLERETKLTDLQNRLAQQNAEAASGKWDEARLENTEREKLQLEDLKRNNEIAAANDIKLLNEARERMGLTPFTRAETAALIELKKNDEARYEAAVHEAMKATNVNYLNVAQGVTDRTRQAVTERLTIENNMDEARKRREVIDGENAALAAQGTTYGEAAGKKLTYDLTEQAHKESLQSQKHETETFKVREENINAQIGNAALDQAITDAGGIDAYKAGEAKRLRDKGNYDKLKEKNDVELGTKIETDRSTHIDEDAQNAIYKSQHQRLLSTLQNTFNQYMYKGIMGKVTPKEFANNVLGPIAEAQGFVAGEALTRRKADMDQFTKLLTDQSTKDLFTDSTIPDPAAFLAMPQNEQDKVIERVMNIGNAAFNSMSSTPKTKTKTK